jgi:DNA repair photolyase
LTPKYRQLVADAAASKRIHHLRSANQIRSFIEAIKKEWQDDDSADREKNGRESGQRKGKRSELYKPHIG